MYAKKQWATYYIVLSQYHPPFRKADLSGKLIGGFCALSGVFILTLPIPIVVNSFAQFYKNRLWRNEVTDTFLIISILVSSIILVIVLDTATMAKVLEYKDESKCLKPLIAVIRPVRDRYRVIIL